MTEEYLQHFDNNFVCAPRLDKWSGTGWNLGLRRQFLVPDLHDVLCVRIFDGSCKWGKWVPSPHGKRPFDYYSIAQIRRVEKQPDYLASRSVAFPGQSFSDIPVTSEYRETDNSLYDLIHAPYDTSDALTGLIKRCYRYGQKIIDVALTERKKQDHPVMSHLEAMIDNTIFDQIAQKDNHVMDSKILEAIRIYASVGLDPLHPLLKHYPKLGEAIQTLGDNPMEIVGKLLGVQPAAKRIEEEELLLADDDTLGLGMIEWADALKVDTEVTAYQYCRDTGLDYPAGRGPRRTMNGKMRKVYPLWAVRTEKNYQAEVTVAPGIIVPVFRKAKDEPAFWLPRIPEYNRSQLLLH